MTKRIHTGAGGYVNVTSKSDVKPTGKKKNPEPKTGKVKKERVATAKKEKVAKTKKEQVAKAKKQQVAKPKKVSAIDAAASVLGKSNQPMTCGELIEAMAAKGLWTSPGGKTPAATLYSAILREIGTKGKDSRFKKTERGKFAAK